MIKSISSLALLVLLSSFFVTFSIAQDDSRAVRAAAGNRYVISAKAGGVNYLQGEVNIVREDSTSGYLVKGDSIEVGERVMTGALSRTEILLNPGSYVRLADNSEFEFVTTNLDNLQLRLNRGSAIFEVYAGDGFFVTVLTPSSKFYLVKSGVYRIDVSASGASRIEVRKGKAQVGVRDSKFLKKSRAADVEGSNVAISKFDRGERDAFENWSRSRSKDLAKANAALRRNTNVRNSIWSDYNSGRFSNYRNAFGLWTYSAAFGGYCYLPFGNTRRTPYGFGLNRNLNSFGFYRTYYYTRRSNSSGSGSRNGTNVQPATGDFQGTRNRGEKRGSSDPETAAQRKARRSERRTQQGSGANVRSRDQRRSNSTRRSSGNSGSTSRSRSSSSRSTRSSPSSRAPRPSPRRASPSPRRSSPPPRVTKARPVN